MLRSPSSSAARHRRGVGPDSKPNTSRSHAFRPSFHVAKCHQQQQCSCRRRVCMHSHAPEVSELGLGGWHRSSSGTGLGRSTTKSPPPGKSRSPSRQGQGVTRRRSTPAAPSKDSRHSPQTTRYVQERSMGMLDGVALSDPTQLSLSSIGDAATSRPTLLDANSWAAPHRTALQEVHVQNFALVEQQRIVFGAGLNVVTGESGSGKSVLVESLAQLLGSPAPTECVRAGADMAVVEGVFWLSGPTATAVREVLSQEGIPRRALPAPQPGRLHLRREILRSEGSPTGSRAGSPDGSSGNGAGAKATLRSRCYVNGSPVTLRTLRALSPLLVDMNGQHSSLALREGSTQVALLDRVAGCTHLASKVSQLVAAMTKVEGQLEALDELSDPRDREQRRKLVEAVKRVKLQAGEEVALRQGVRALEASRHLAEQCAAARAALAGDGTGGGVVSVVKSLEAQLRAAQPRGTILKRGSPAPAAVPGRALATPASRLRSATPMTGAQRPAVAAPVAQAAAVADEEDDEEDGEEAVGVVEEEEEEEEEVGPLEQALEALAAARQQLAAAENLVRTAARQSSQDMLEYDDKSDRLQLIDKLLRSQRVRTSEELLAAAELAQSQLETYDNMAEHAEEWELELESLRVQLLETCLALSAARRAAAPQLAVHLEACLAELAMGGARVAVAVSWQPELRGVHLRECEALEVPEEHAQPLGEQPGMFRVRPGSAGLDMVELRLAPGPGEPLRPLSAVASGGESARVMLALKAAPSALHAAGNSHGLSSSAFDGNGLGAAETAETAEDAAAAGPTPLMVLDELDSGIGSRLGANVGAMLRRMAGEVPVADQGAPMALNPGSQIICVTHLPQVACYASHHIKVLKGSGGRPEGRRVTTCFEVLGSTQARAREVAEMMGMEVSLAEDMLKAAQEGGLPAGGSSSSMSAGSFMGKGPSYN